jgi:tetratricopeptide (TPR) repeat protein
MPKKAILLLLSISICISLKAQTADAIYERYLDFNLARLEGKTTEAFKIAEGITANIDKLPAKSRTSFYNGLAKLYEDDEQSVEAIPLYEKVAAAEPDYYVVHRALGYLYLKTADELYPKVQLRGKEVFDKYKTAVLKALPHLEKAQACDPSDETLALIKKLYANINDAAALQSLNSRLSTLGKSCVDILTE